MDKFNHIPRYDTLDLYEQKQQIRQLIGEEETIFYSCQITKFNKYGAMEERTIVVTSSEIWTFEQQSNKYED